MKHGGSLNFSSPLRLEWPNPAPCSLLCTSAVRSGNCTDGISAFTSHLLVAGGFTELKLRVSLKPVTQPCSPLKCSETQYLQGDKEAKGGVRKTSYVCGVIPCCWKVSKDISGADETFQRIHLESAVSLPSCIIYHTIFRGLKDCCKLFSESSFPLRPVSCNNLPEIYFGSDVLQQRCFFVCFLQLFCCRQRKLVR